MLPARMLCQSQYFCNHWMCERLQPLVLMWGAVLINPGSR